MAGYFTYFPQFTYDVKGDGTAKLVTDILRRVKVRNQIRDNVSFFDKYNVQDGESPEDIAYKLYGDSELHWVVLMVNDVKDRFFDWPLSQIQFQNYLQSKYSDPDGVHHYEITQSSGPTTSTDNSHIIEVNSSEVGATAVTNREYEDRLQDSKRQIQILDPDYLPYFVTEFEKQIGRG